MPKKYEMSEEDIDKVINLLKIIDPVNATPEQAMFWLEKKQADIHLLAHKDPEELLKMWEKVKKKRPKKG